MTPLYRKIFITCGLGCLVLLAVGVGGSFFIVADRMSDFAGRRTSIIAAEAAEVLEQGGVPALERWLRARDANPKLESVYLVDGRGRDVMGRQVPGHISERTQDLLAKPKIGHSPGFSPAQWVPQLAMPDGEMNVVFVVAKQPGLLQRIDIYYLPFVLLLLAVGVSGLVASVLARWLSSPILELAGATRALARGQQDVRVHERATSREDELGGLARDFNAMAAKLDHLLKMREQLIRDMSHELRTPLARLNVALELLRRKDPDQRFARDHGRIQQQVDRLDQMIEGILGFAKLDALSEPPHFDTLDLRELVGETVADAEIEAEQREVVIEFDHSVRGRVPVRANPAILRSAIQNVLRNAIRYTASGSRIIVALGAGHGEALLSIRDQGPGVPSEHLDRIFEPFYRVDDSRGRDPGGTGLGLAIVARVMAAHRGSATARNLPSGGLELQLRLPLVTAATVAWEPDFVRFAGAAQRSTPRDDRERPE